jgi:Zn-dependent M28 family amino/carboxypeptidase
VLAVIVLAAVAAAVFAVARGGADGSEARPAPAAPNRFDGARAFRWLELQVKIGPRPAGSEASRRLAGRLRRALPGGRFQTVPGGLRNVIGTVPGRERGRLVVVGAHYDSKDIPGFVGANDGAGGTAAVVELARAIRPRTIAPTVVFILFDGEETPRGVPDSEFEKRGLRGSKIAAPRYKRAEAMVLLDFIADKRLSIPREGYSNEALWGRLRSAARRVGTIRYFPAANRSAVLDDHLPFLREGVPSINLIDFDFPCWHKTCDDLSAVSQRSLDASGETVLELLRAL